MDGNSRRVQGETSNKARSIEVGGSVTCQLSLSRLPPAQCTFGFGHLGPSHTPVDVWRTLSLYKVKAVIACVGVIRSDEGALMGERFVRT